MNLIKKLSFAALLSLTLIGNAFAVSLADAKSNGWVGERYTGYLGIVSHSEQVSGLVNEVNGKRSARYKELAINNGIALQEVEGLAGKKVIEKTEPGHYIDLGNGWVKK